MSEKLNVTDTKSIIQRALAEDLGQKGDITSGLLIDRNYNVQASIISCQEGVLSGVDVAGLVFKTISKKTKIKTLLKDGDKFKPGQVIAGLSGPARDILAAERTALNFLGALSGIATLTHEFVQRAKPYPVKILDTRKTTPNLRGLEKYAVRCGGAQNHRRGLYDQILIKDNHIEAFINKIAPPGRARDKKISRAKAISMILQEFKKARIKKRLTGIKIEIEVETLDELRSALDGRPDIIMLDNMNLNQIKRAVNLRNKYSPRPGKKRTLLEISGGVTLKRIAKLAASGVDMISVGALTHSAPTVDFSLEVY